MYKYYQCHTVNLLEITANCYWHVVSMPAQMTEQNYDFSSGISSRKKGTAFFRALQNQSGLPKTSSVTPTNTKSTHLTLAESKTFLKSMFSTDEACLQSEETAMAETQLVLRKKNKVGNFGGSLSPPVAVAV